MSHKQAKQDRTDPARPVIAKVTYEGDLHVPQSAPEEGSFVKARLRADPRLIGSPIIEVWFFVSSYDAQTGTINGYTFGAPAVVHGPHGVQVVPNIGPAIGVRYSADDTVVPSWFHRPRPAPLLHALHSA